MLAKISGWASILGFVAVLINYAWRITMWDRSLFLELALIVIVGVSVAIYLREKAHEFSEKMRWLFDYPDTDADAKDDKNLYMRINRLITAMLKTRP